MSSMMRYITLFFSFFSLTIACTNPNSDPCASALTASSAAAITFCATYTQSKNTATTSLPSYASFCSNKPSKLSSACSCLKTASTTFNTVTTIVTSTTVKSTSTPKTSSTAIKSTISTSTKASTTASQGPGGSQVCTCTAFSQISSAVASCTNIVLSGIAAPSGSTIDLTKLKAGTTVTFAGSTTFGTTKSSSFNPIEITGTDILITGAPGHVIDGNGQAYWDGQGSNGGQSKPDHFIVANKIVNSRITNLNIRNWPVHCWDITKCDGLVISGLTMDNRAGDAPNAISSGLPAAHNSDGFDLSSTSNTVITGSTVYNQDDCVAVTSGSNITVNEMFCSGGHGLSIGSVGGKSNNTVIDIMFSDSQIVNSQNGCRIKTNSGTTGQIQGVTYRNITLTDISVYGIDVQQDYLNGGPTGEPTNGVTIADLTFDTVTGSAASSARNYYILCGSGSCSDFTFTNVDIAGGGVSSSCNFPSSGCP